MYNGNRGRPLTKRQTVRLLIGLTILAWATQTLLAQWGFGSPPTTAPVESASTPERFVPGSPRFDNGATLELRAEATVIGEEVKLKQICRWSESDEAVLAPIGDLVLARLGQATPFRSISIDEIKGTLRDAGVNIAALNFVGAVACTVNRSDVEYDERTALQQWIDARQQQHAGGTTPTTAPAVADSRDDTPVQSLRALLAADLAQRLSLPVESIQMTFRPQDEKLLALAEPLFKFQIDPPRARNLGNLSWSVLIVSGGSTQTSKIQATARAWQKQIVVAKPLAFKQVIRQEDLIERRTLVDRLDDDPPITDRELIVGQQAARDLNAGTVLSARMIDPVQLVRTGQYVTVSLSQGSVQVKSVARALESGGYGQTIRVRNEVTRDVFQVVMTGPQTATMNLAANPTPPVDPTNIANARD